MLSPLLAIFIVASLAPLLYKVLRGASHWLLILLPAWVIIYLLNRLPEVLEGKKIEQIYPWVESLGINLVFYLDGLSLFFAIIIALFGIFIILYAASYLKGHEHLGRFYFYLMLFMGSMIGLVTSGNIIAMFVFWELTSISSYLLIGFNNRDENARRFALQALLVTAFGGLALLGGLILTGHLAGTYLLSELLSMDASLITTHAFYPFILVLVLLGAFTKSAQVPFHFWLPNAMAAPTPVSAYLHSATMVKVGVFFLARFTPVYGGTIEWHLALTIVGCLTMLIGAFLAYQHSDLKKILAYTTVSALGVMVMLIGIGTESAFKAAIIFLLAHAFYKATLFLVAGNVDHGSGSREVSELRGLKAKMPFTAFAAAVAALSMAGVPPLFGFIGKEMLYEATLSLPSFFSIILVIATLISSAFFVVIAIQLGYKIFFGKPNELSEKAHEATPLMLIGPVLLAIGGLVLGIYSAFAEGLLYRAITALSPLESDFYLTLWHGFNLVLLLSVLTLLLGLVLFKYRTSFMRRIDPYTKLSYYGPEHLYEINLGLLRWFAIMQTNFFQNGKLRYYITTIIGTFSAMLLYLMFIRQPLYQMALPKISGLYLYEVFFVFMIVTSIIFLMVARSRLTALVNMGVIGFGLAMIFIFFSAPDLAMTLFLVETLTVVLFVLVLHRLPRFKIFTRRIFRLRYFLLSATFGLMMTFILLLVTGLPLDSHLKQAYAERAVSEGHGRNIVNVILVDFRALDTFGEIAVLGIAAIGIYSLIHLRNRKK